MSASAERLGRDVETIAGFSSHGPGINRLSFTPEYWGAVEYVSKRLGELGYERKMTSHGNSRFRKRGSDWWRPAVVVGSHLDAVPNGGRFDGVAGVVAAVECARLMEEGNIVLGSSFEVVIFAEEEGSRFGHTLTGSKAMVGALSATDMGNMRDANGISYLEAFRDHNIGTSDKDVLAEGDIVSYFELHIEQSIVLETRQAVVGIVEAITGLEHYLVTLTGITNHAGATPMDLRSDSLAAAAEIIQLIEKAGRSSSTTSTVATVGKIENQPNAVNVIPGRTAFSIDIRDTDVAGLERTVAVVLTGIQAIAAGRNIGCVEHLLTKSPPVMLSRRLREDLVAAAKSLDISYLEMPSGAAHDAQEIARIADVGMVFVPSVGGRSHCPEEETSYENIAHGVDVLMGGITQTAFSCQSTRAT